MQITGAAVTKSLSNRIGGGCKVAVFPLLVSIWLILRGVEASDSISLATVLSIQMFTGSYFWTMLISDHVPARAEKIGMGIAIGTALATISDQIFLSTPLKPIAWFIPTIAVLALKRRDIFAGLSGSQHPNDYSWLYSVAIAVLLGFGQLLNGSAFAISLLAAGYFLGRRKSGRTQLTLFVLCVLLGFLAQRIFRPEVQYGTWRLYPLYTGTDDLIFSESLANSLSSFGLHEYAAAIGNSVQYHWFSLAWTGLMTRISTSQPFDVTLHLAPMVAFLGIASLVWSITARMSKSTLAPFFAIIALFATESLPESMLFYYVLNTSNLLSFVWALASALLFYFVLQKQSFALLIAFSFSVAITLLAKTPYGALIYIAALLTCLFNSVRDPKRAKFYLALISTTTLFVVLTYSTFLKPNVWEQRTFNFDIDPFQFGRFSLSTFVGTVVLVSCSYFLRFPISPKYLFGFIKTSTFGINTFVVLVIFGSTARYMFEAGSAENYFMNVSLVFGSILIGLSLSFSLDGMTRFIRFAVLTQYILVTVFSALIVSRFIDETQIDTWVLGRNNLNLLSAFFAVVSSVVGWLIISNYSNIKIGIFRPVLIVSLIGVSSGIYLANSATVQEYSFTDGVASTRDIKALEWLKDRGTSSDVVATNRFLCNQESPCSFDDSSFLISAVSGLRVYLEGPRFVIGGRPYPDWAKERVNTSVDFANSANEEAFNALKASGVKWFYVDRNFLSSGDSRSVNRWKDWATVEYSDANVLILNLRNN
jgi:hypothetical protein